MRARLNAKLPRSLSHVMSAPPDSAGSRLSYYFGAAGAVAPFVVFLSGVAWLGLSGAPDERGFWPLLLAGLACGVLLTRDRSAYAEAVLAGMSRPIVLLMVMAWLLAGVLASLLRASGMVEALVGVCQSAGLTGGGYALAAFAVCALVSTATGTSLGTILLCSPLLFPAGVSLSVDGAVLIGAILGGATFGDNISPVSDTTIASATTQGADLGGVVRSRLRYALPAALLASVAYVLLGGSDTAAGGVVVATSSLPLVMLLVPAAVIALLLLRQHLLVGLILGVVAAAVLGLVLGLFAASDLIYIDAESFGARGLIVEGFERGIGVSIFTILLAGLVSGIEASGLVDRLVARLSRGVTTVRGAETSIFASVSGAVLLTTHSVVAILAVGPLTRRLGEQFGVSAYRRSNLLDVTVCTFPFLLPYMIPTILAAATTNGHEGVTAVSPFQAGLYNFHSWALLLMILLAVFGGYGRDQADVRTVGRRT
jgi:Na+/H+ antiporter NhaC